VTQGRQGRRGTRAAGRFAARCLAAAVAALGLAACTTATRSSAPSPATFDPALVRRGETLAALGDCRGCHTAPSG
jgi:hypothetical protein